MLLFVLALCFVASINAQNNTSGGGCAFTDVLPDASYQKLVAEVNSAAFGDDKIKVIQRFVNSNNTYGLTSSQIAGLYNRFNFLDNRIAFMSLINPLVLSVTVDGTFPKIVR